MSYRGICAAIAALAFGAACYACGLAAGQWLGAARQSPPARLVPAAAEPRQNQFPKPELL